MDAETFIDPALITFAEENFISYHLNVDSTQNKELSKNFNITGIPAFVFVDEEGNEVDRIVGYMPPQEYLAEMTRIRNGINTVPDLIRQLEDDPDNADLLVNLAGKVESMSGLKVAMTYWEMLFALDGVDPVLHSTAALKMALYHAKENEDPETLVSFINNETNTEVLPKAYDALRNFYRGAKDKEAEADTYRRYVDFMSGVHKESTGFLNGYAWRMTELELNLENALERVTQGIDMLAEDASAREKAQVMDTKGEVLWKLGRIDEAVAIMDECIVLQPEDVYYQEQKAKFQTPS
ncbi:MAG: thioredoxin fold domain-containing protein [Candidatus Marinimicrobia bacterium]|nr:thioredoxin fold domain-containing protein [FCB group bacterium]MBL7025923.1 thioredoxin fold domain-containing protein [Candidatus Neomarinimicrobiota bacterium]